MFLPNIYIIDLRRGYNEILSVDTLGPVGWANPTQTQTQPQPQPNPTQPIVKIERGSANPACFEYKTSLVEMGHTRGRMQNIKHF